MDKKKLMLIGSIVVIVLTVASYFKRGGGDGVPVNRGAAEAFGQGLAEETTKLVGNPGAVVIFCAELNTVKDPTTAAQLDALEAALAKRAGMKVAGVERVKVDALSSMGGSPAGFLAKEFLAVSQKYPAATGIVSLVGAPQLSADEMTQMAAKNLKCLVVVKTESSLKELFQNNVVHVVILPQKNAPPVGNETLSNPQEWFAQHYQVITSAALR